LKCGEGTEAEGSGRFVAPVMRGASFAGAAAPPRLYDSDRRVVATLGPRKTSNGPFDTAMAKRLKYKAFHETRNHETQYHETQYHETQYHETQTGAAPCTRS